MRLIMVFAFSILLESANASAATSFKPDDFEIVKNVTLCAIYSDGKIISQAYLDPAVYQKFTIEKNGSTLLVRNYSGVIVITENPDEDSVVTQMPYIADSKEESVTLKNNLTVRCRKPSLFL